MKRVIVLAALVACGEPAVGTSEQAVISDQVHSGGTFGFYFLPPMVPQPALAGSLDMALAPTVVIDELATGHVIATFAARVTADNYIVNWDTKAYALDDSAVYRIHVRLGAREIGFADVQVVASASQAKNVATNEYVALVDGRTLPIKFWMNQCAPVTCAALDACHVAGSCDVATGSCSNPTAADGTTCDSGDGTCSAGTCVATTCAYTPAAAVGYQVIQGWGSQNLLVADVDNDGKLDIVIPDYSGWLSTLRGNGDGTFAAALESRVPGYANDADLADFDGDGILDAVSTTYTTGFVQIQHGNGDGTFQLPMTVLSTPTYTGHVLARDLDGDGKPDIAVIADGKIAVYLEQADRTFGAPIYYPASDPAMLAIGDLDGNGSPDIIVSNRTTNEVGVLLNNSDGTFHAGASVATGVYPEHVRVGDVNGDGKLDVVTGNYVGNSLGVLLGNGDGTLHAAVQYALPNSGWGDYSVSLALGDLDNDGDLDAAVGGYNNSSGAGTIYLLKNDGHGAYSSWQTLTGGTNTNDVLIADVDHDGVADLLSSEHSIEVVRVQRGTCP